MQSTCLRRCCASQQYLRHASCSLQSCRAATWLASTAIGPTSWSARSHCSFCSGSSSSASGQPIAASAAPSSNGSSASSSRRRCSSLTASSSSSSSSSLLVTAVTAGSIGASRLCSHHSTRINSVVAAAADTTSASSSSSAGPRPPATGSEISSAANGYIKHCVKLRDSSRYRQQQRRLLVAGATLLTELAGASAGGLQAVTLFLKPGATPPAGLSADSVITVTDGVMRKLTGLEETAGVTMVAELSMPPLLDLSLQQQQQQQQQDAGLRSQEQPHQQQQRRQQAPVQLQRLLVLEGVQDPGNLGTLLRCAAAFGWDAVWLLPGCCDPFNDKALRASRGAGFKVPLAAGTLDQLLGVVGSRGMLLLAAEPDPGAESDGPPAAAAVAVGEVGNGASSTITPRTSSSSSSSKAWPQGRPVALVLGSEGSGLSREVLAVAQPLAVPMVGDMESLNVGVAGSILMFCLSQGWGQLTGRLQALQLLP